MDEAKIELEGDSHPVVALALLKIIMTSHADEKPDRDWILSTYADCLAVVGGAEVEFDDDDTAEDDAPARAE